MIKVTQYIHTLGTEKFNKFLSSSFNYNMICNVNDETITTLFEGWSGKIINGNIICKNPDNNVTLQFNDTYYQVRQVGSSVKLHLPDTINDFINTMLLLEIDLYWTDWIDENFEPKDYLEKNKIEDYYADLLHKMDKGAELITEKYGRN